MFTKSELLVAGIGLACYYHAQRSPMDIQGILAELQAEKDRLERAIAALSGGGRHSLGAVSANGRRGRRRLTAASKKRISDAMKKAWAARKKAASKVA
jgi:hypothetical protein